MLQTRIIPTLLLRNESLVKTTQFSNFRYVGDPCNTIRIFNECEVDELLILDILASKEERPPNMKILKEIANECFMPLGYGGGVRDLETAKQIFKIGFEKIVVNSFALENPEFVKELSDYFGSQAIIVSIDVKKSIFNGQLVYSKSGSKKYSVDPVDWAKTMQEFGAGEILITSIDREGTWAGFDVELVSSVSNAVNIPVIAHGGCGSLKDAQTVVRESGASAVAVGSMVVFQKKNRGVLVNFPERHEVEGIFL